MKSLICLYVMNLSTIMHKPHSNRFSKCGDSILSKFFFKKWADDTISNNPTLDIQRPPILTVGVNKVGIFNSKWKLCPLPYTFLWNVVLLVNNTKWKNLGSFLLYPVTKSKSPSMNINFWRHWIWYVYFFLSQIH